MSEERRRNFELDFVEHSPEFNRFFKNHAKLNEEIAGLSEKRFYEFGKEQTITITRENFWMGIKTLHAYIIDNIHYVKRYDDHHKILELFDKLEEEYLNDVEYNNIAIKERNHIAISEEENAKISIKYLKYLVWAFEIAFRLNMLLKPTIMVNIDGKKDLIFREEGQFYLSLSNYRDLMKEDIANFRVQHTFSHLIRVLAYCYTYKHTFLPDEIQKMDLQIKEIYELFTIPLTYLIISESKRNNYDTRIVNYFAKKMRSILSKLYEITNYYLTSRKVLPQEEKYLYENFTLI